LTSEVLFGRKTVAWATWILTPDPGTTEIDLVIQPESRSLATRFVLLGGRRWIARRLETTLATLATTAARAAEDVVAAPAADIVATPPAAREQDVQLQAGHAPIHR
jgi:hypothetical protein